MGGAFDVVWTFGVGVASGVGDADISGVKVASRVGVSVGGLVAVLVGSGAVG